ncbi:heparan sulfate glucosamine 3-O-sulfotransferase 5-like [Mizuhopecten yessoensis]|uniref:Heparan sulfate glucosamine 3-O-sulfotransferase 5 n=1 Tax=Mizuhopecten yessoensis TaxID=6573 RepID=A0A210PRG5_MIZYE|nr:heparan sulfate glucosamine 3-O-sulfotransferase 5-like [Mizuhopecten yessoensis]XP_021376997.1 heparan sulfate glucosamine 3-O-sulfotransferase 5-like [Mizuhopecten yessoensis]XP_021376998.1 heparan sulfate glucosamine 3-O-sulfotransferase 5-like [Mizuhopecten yessoensis]XP_021376999.1 heparan sulfate glucosamine 3-O-sulfotransferase 5-like [Mizuhopecten yessoensis]XP_021377000.1 heparan sulfate glucosamine 3-O-sulfotransferase 5-like [Mizuhopecten yessoensis]XP_021377001.1 heparan sulfate
MSTEYPSVDRKPRTVYMDCPGIFTADRAARERSKSRLCVTTHAACITMKGRGRQLWMLMCVICVVLCFSAYSNSVVWRTMGANRFSPNEELSVAGARKLLEEEEWGTEKPHPPGTDKRLPQSIIFGVRKCGTRAMLEFLGLHPQIRPADHEVHYFDDDVNYNMGIDWYKSQMPYSFHDQVTIEKSPRYFIAEKVPERISNMNSSIKLIVLLRNPTVRVISDYTQVYYNKKAKGKAHDKLENLAIDLSTGEVNTRYKAVRISIYHQHFERWLKVFRPDQFHIVDGDNLIVRPWEEIAQVEEFLGLPHKITREHFYFNSTRGFYCMKLGHEKCLGATKGRRHPFTDPVAVEKLRAFFKPHNQMLFQLINRTFDWK